MAPAKKCAKRAAPAQESKTPAGKQASSASKHPSAASTKAVEDVLAAQQPPAKKPKAADDAVAAQVPVAKKPKVDAVMAGIEEGILMETELPEVVTNMLLAGLPGSLGVPQSERREVQDAIVKMVGRTLGNVEAKLQATLEEAEAALSGVEAAGALRKAKVIEAEDALASIRNTLEDKRATVATATQELEAAHAALAESLAAQQEGDAPVEKVRRSKEQLDKAIDVELSAVVAGNAERDAAKANCEALLPIAADLGLDESLLSALPAACAKKAFERGHFDKVVVDALETSLKEGREAMIKTLAAEAPASDQRAAVVKEAEGEAENAKVRLTQAIADFSDIEATETEATKAKQAALDAVEKAEPEHKEAVEHVEEQQEKLNRFRQYNLTNFHSLRDKGSKLEEAAAPAQEDAPMEPVTEGVKELVTALETTVSSSVAGA